jgi:ATP-dependent DNA ligase
MKRKGIMLCYPFSVERLRKWAPPYLVQPKLDGERCRAIIKGGEVTLLSSEENEILSVPHINSALKDLKLHAIELDGELYRHGMPRNDIHSIVGRTVNLSPDYGEMEFHVFDVVNNDPQSLRILRLPRMLHQESGIVRRVSHEVLWTEEDVVKEYDRIIGFDYEGIVIRHIGAPYVRKRSTYMMKFKPKKDDFYKIVGWKQEVSINGVPKDRLGAVICVDDVGTEFSVGSGLTDEQRVKYWEERDSLINKFCHVKYQHLSPKNHVPLHSVFLDIVDIKEVIDEKYVGIGGSHD